MGCIDVINPATGKREEMYEEDTPDDVDAALGRATSAFGEWRDWPISEREHLLDAAGNVLRENKREYAETMTREMGKPITQALAEVEKCAWPVITTPSTLVPTSNPNHIRVHRDRRSRRCTNRSGPSSR
jgi:acyl-CoA reductase-like NAD-dependent aldehyde dehydrogenase